MMTHFPNNKYGLLRGKPYVNSHRKLLLGLYFGLIVVFLLLFSQCCKFLKYPLFLLILSILNVLFALAKSNDLYKLIINERAILNDLDTKDFVRKNQIKTNEVMIFSVVVYYLNYTALALSICMITLVFLISDVGVFRWLLIINSALGIGIFVLGNFIGNNTTSITDKEPELLAIEQCAIEERENELKKQGKERKHKDRIEIDRNLRSLRIVDFFWLLWMVVGIVVWLLRVYRIIGQTYD